MSCHFLLGRRASTELAKFWFLCQTTVFVFFIVRFRLYIFNSICPMSLPQRIPYGFSACLILALLLFFLAEAHARSASGEERGSRTSVELKTSDGSLSNGQTPKLELRTFTIEMLNGGVVRSQLRDGAVMTLTCKLALERVRILLSNEVISGESRSYQLRHDLLSREFILSSPGHPIVRQKQFDTLLASAFQHLDFLLPLQAPLVSGETYRVQLKITLEHAEVPPWLEKALFFWSWEVTPPLSFSQDFIF